MTGKPAAIAGREVRLEVEAEEMLADVLRARLGLTGTKIGCGEAECGSCTVLVDGEAVLSCVLPAAKAAGHHVLPNQGLGAGRCSPAPPPPRKRRAIMCSPSRGWRRIEAARGSILCKKPSSGMARSSA